MNSLLMHIIRAQSRRLHSRKQINSGRVEVLGAKKHTGRGMQRWQLLKYSEALEYGVDALCSGEIYILLDQC